tara:strand:+ start:4329 stop:5648 length:1320 start_codon:yes stop_codon:yes gene_type:complete
MAEQITLHQGDSAEVLKQYPDNHFDSIVTDPPYGIEFLGKDWDKNTGPIEVWRECLRVLKPGGHILAFSAARTYHRLATNLEDIGFEIRDQIMWIYGSGFPKGQDMGKRIQRRKGVEEYSGTIDTTKNIGFGASDHARVRAGEEWSTGVKENGLVVCTDPLAQEWEGWKTALKPAHEPIVMARKPFKGSTIDNVLKHGTGAINIDDTRVGFSAEDKAHYEKLNEGGGIQANRGINKYQSIGEDASHTEYKASMNTIGRYPSNVIMSEEEGEVLDEKTGIIKSSGGKAKPKEYNATGYKMKPKYDTYDTGAYNNEPLRGASKYFYCPKVSRKERNIGFDLKDIPTDAGVMFNTETGVARAVEVQERNKNVTANNHPTVKPVALMKYLVTLITPKGGKVLDPFNGSGSTGMAVKEFGGEYTGIDLDANYIEIASKRIEAWK